ncbi:MAG: ABC transporter substrate-binding protein [Bacilli bacterium]
MKFTKYVMVMMLMFIVVGCSKDKSPTEQENASQGEETNSHSDKELVIWSYYSGMTDAIRLFEERYKEQGYKIVYESFTYEEYVQKYLDALVTGDVPDMMIIDSNEIGSFNSLKAFKDLNTEYNFGKYRDDFDPELIDVGTSFDGKHLIGLPFASAPYVTFYRADILESYGFPSDPEELGEYLEDPKAWLEIGKTMKKDNRYVFQWAADPVLIMSRSIQYYDDNLNFILTQNPNFTTAIETARQARDQNLIAYTDLWTTDGQQKLKDGKFPMLYLGSWGANQLKEWVPEQAGKWRVTRLPMDVYGWNNSTLFSVPEKAQNDELAWKFIEFYLFEYPQEDILGNVTGYLPFRNNPKANAHKNEFLGNQLDQKLYETVMANTKETKISPLYQRTYSIWVEQFNTGLEENYTLEQIIKNINNEVTTQLAGDKESLLKSR